LRREWNDGVRKAKQDVRWEGEELTKSKEFCKQEIQRRTRGFLDGSEKQGNNTHLGFGERKRRSCKVLLETTR
jgi:hypothetical protein